MKYKTTNEWNHFVFSEAYVGDLQAASGFFHIVLDNVIILPENSCNRDIRRMRANELLFKIENMAVEALIEEGFKRYDANGKLLETSEDRPIGADAYGETLKSLIGGSVYSLEKQENTYVFTIDAPNERTYEVRIAGTGDTEEWERFLNLE